MSGVSSRPLRLACLTAVSALAIGASGISFPPVHDIDLELGGHGHLRIGAVRTDVTLLGTAVAQVPGLQENLNRALQGIGGAETVTLDDTIERARHYGAIARDALALFPPGAMKQALLDTVDFCIERGH